MRFATPLLLFAFTACAFHSTAQRFEDAFDPAMSLCMEEHFPNPAVSLTKAQAAERHKAFSARRQAAEAIFDNPKGEAYLQAELADQVDEQKAFCVSEMLKRVQETES